MAKRAFAIILSLVGCTAASAQPPADSVRFDLRCLLATTVVGSQASGEGRAAAMVVSTYFLGRLDGSLPAAQLEARLNQEAQELQASQIGEIARACAAVTHRRGQEVRDIGRRMGDRR
jgi:hypothetical protein